MPRGRRASRPPRVPPGLDRRSARLLPSVCEGRFSPPIRPGAQPRLRDRWCPPAAMHLVDDFLATGTQIKTERPGKAAGVVPRRLAGGADGQTRQRRRPADRRPRGRTRDQKRRRGDPRSRRVSGQLRRVRREQPPARPRFLHLRVVDPGTSQPPARTYRPLEDDPESTSSSPTPRKRWSGPSSTTRRFILSTPSSGTTSRSTPFGRSPRPSRTDGSRATPTVTTACSFSSTHGVRPGSARDDRHRAPPAPGRGPPRDRRLAPVRPHAGL